MYGGGVEIVVAYVYKLIPTDLTYKDVKRLLNEDPLELFEFTGDLVEDLFGCVRLHRRNVWHEIIAVEYFIPIKVICANKSTKLFIEV